MDFGSTLLAFVTATYQQLILAFVLVALNLIFGVIVAIKAGKFEWKLFSNYLLNAVPMVLAWWAIEFIMALVLALELDVSIVNIFADFSPALVYFGIILTFVGSLIGHFAALGAWPGDGQKRFGIQPTKEV